MVNTGKPSTGCHLCRARRIKCDEAKPHCMRCQKSKRACPGYRDSFELNLRDEMKSIKKKTAQPPNLHRSTASEYSVRPYIDAETSSPPWSSPSSSFAYHSPASSTSSLAINSSSCNQHMTLGLRKSLSTPFDEQASCFFLSNYVLIPEAVTTRGFFDFLVPLLQKEHAGSPLSVAFSAVSLAAFGARPASKDILLRADTIYVKSLNQLNLVLQDPKLALKDSTLAAVLLLAFYETLTSSQLTIKGWVSHIDGAVALAKSRGEKQMDTQIGRQLFSAIQSQMAVASIANSKRVRFGVDWWENMTPSDEVSRIVNMLNLRVADLRANSDTAISMAPRTPNNVEKVVKLLRDAEALEQEFSEWFESLPPLWRANTVAWVDFVPEADLPFSTCHPGRIHLHSELWMASRYIIALSSRLFVSTTILRCCAWLSSPLDYRCLPEYTTAARLCAQIIEDIVASVPYFFGWRPEEETAPSISHFACGDDDHKTTPKGLCGYFSLWPIFCAATSDFSTETQRTWLCGRMKYISESMGISQASLLLQVKKLRYPSMFIYRDAMNLPPSNCKVPVSLPASPASSEDSEPALDPDIVEESEWNLKLIEARMLQLRHMLDISPSKFENNSVFRAV